METAIFIVGVVAIGLLGFATQRGGTCAVASIVEVVAERRPGRLFALIEISVLVSGGLVLLDAAGLVSAMPVGYAVSVATVAGGIVLGTGAFLNRSCPVGTIARIGSGQWAYLATPIGFFLGSLAMSRVAAPEHLAQASILLKASGWIAILCVAILAFRLLTHGSQMWQTGHGPLRYFWSPHVATTISGLAYLVVLVAVGGWTYTGTLRELARGATIDATRELLLFVALMAGAVLGGWTAGLKPKAPSAGRVGRCLAGGGLMGVGASLIPGGTDGLIFVGMPMLWPYAWLAFASMCATIYVAVKLASPD